MTCGQLTGLTHQRACRGTQTPPHRAEAERPTPIPTLFWQVSRRVFWGAVTPVHCGFTHILWQCQATGRSAALGQPFMKPRDLRKDPSYLPISFTSSHAPHPPTHTLHIHKLCKFILPLNATPPLSQRPTLKRERQNEQRNWEIYFKRNF